MLEEKNKEISEYNENFNYDNESIPEQIEDELTYLVDEVEDEYDVPTIKDKYTMLTMHLTLSNFFALVVAAKWIVLVLMFGGSWIGLS